MLVCEFSKSGQAGHVNKCIDAMNNLIWKYNIIALEKLILCMSLRTHEGSEAQVHIADSKDAIPMLLKYSLSTAVIILEFCYQFNFNFVF